jgi:hypothetical protein
MFQGLLAARHSGAASSRAEAERLAIAGDASARFLLEFVGGLPRFAFTEALAESMRSHGLDLNAEIAAGRFEAVLDHLLTPTGLDYAGLPKALLLFHRYDRGARTALEEHLVEAAATVRDGDGRCRLHFTLSPEHESRFRSLLERVRPSYQGRFEARFEVGSSVQKPSTDTIAADEEGRPFRIADGRLLFRPGGHGALIENLADLGGDVVLIKNVDNVVPETRLETTRRWKRALTAHLVGLEARIHRHLEALEADAAALEAAERFARQELSIEVAGDRAARRQTLRRKLERPLRVCGVVRNTGEPGGGPFWVRDADGSLSLQIVEGAQIDSGSAAQRAIFAASTHFNPVDLVCSLRDRHGRSFDLRRFVDPQAVFLSRKSHEGRTLLALERPGLWNGAMADWITVFVEVPLATFNPVKTVNDLLRPEHQG